MGAVAWACCWLSPPNKVYDAIVEIQQHLAEKNVELVLFGDPAIQQHYPNITVIDVPFYIAETGRRYAAYAAAVPFPQSSLSLTELIGIDRAWGSKISDLEAELLVLRANAFWEKAFAVMQPSVMLSWGATAPMARMMFNIARRFQRPAFVFERGLLEDTISYSSLGQGTLSNFNTTLALVDPDLDDPEISSAWYAIQKYYNSATDRHYPEINREPDDQVRSHFVNSPRPRVLYLGSHDIGSGASFSPDVLGDLQGTWIKSSSDGAAAVEKSLTELNFGGSLWIKPHGASYFDASNGDAPFYKAAMPNIDVYSLVEHSDICVTLTSSTQILSLIKGKPVVTLGNGQLTGRDICYEARSHQELSETLLQALNRDGWEERLKRGRAIIAAGYRQTHVGIAKGAPTQFDLSDFSKLIWRFAMYAPSDIPSAKDRIASFIDFAASALDVSSVRETFNRSNPFSEIDRLTLQVSKLEESNSYSFRAREEALANLNECEDLRARQKIELDDLLVEIEQVRSELQQSRLSNHRLASSNAESQKALRAAETMCHKLAASLEQRFAEIASLTNYLDQETTEFVNERKIWATVKRSLARQIGQFLSASVVDCKAIPGLQNYRLKKLEHGLVSSGLFDEDWYGSKYGGVQSGSSVKHFLNHGLNTGIPPNSLLE
ncbi:hypothetical protein LJR235_004530 [Pararhizobium sp. LjRoot235]|uniref:hypothetical protein n=1 Tax=Pararhizobium sp. LjRoot235 TaxID=3342291 RepID=UPI003ECEC4ED